MAPAALPTFVMKLFRRLLVALLLGVAIYGAFVAFSGYSQISASMLHFDWSAFVAALALASLNYLLRFFKWQYYLRQVNVRGIAVVDSLLVFLSGFVLTITPGKVGEVFKSAILRQTHGVEIERTAPIVVAERLTDVVGVVILILFGSASFRGGLIWAGLGALLVACALVLIFWPTPARWAFERLRSSWMVSLVPRLESAYRELQVLASPQTLWLPSILSVFAWALEGIALFVLLLGFDQTVSLFQACFFYATATLAGAVTPLPGGLGVTEALIQQQLVRLSGVAEAAATSSMLLVRLATLWWAVLVGFLALGILKLRFPKLMAEPHAAKEVAEEGGASAR